MTDALTPAQALEYLRTLSADIIDATVLGADGSLLAGSPELADLARALLAAAPDAADVEVSTAEGSVFAARSDAYAVVLVCGRSRSRRSCASTCGWCSATSRASGATSHEAAAGAPAGLAR